MSEHGTVTYKRYYANKETGKRITVQATIKLESIIKSMTNRALRSKLKKSTIMDGMIVVHVTEE